MVNIVIPDRASNKRVIREVAVVFPRREPRIQRGTNPDYVYLYAYNPFMSTMVDQYHSRLRYAPQPLPERACFAERPDWHLYLPSTTTANFFAWLSVSSKAK